MAVIQKAISEATSLASGMAVAGKKIHEHARQAEQKASIEAEAEKQAKEAVQKEAEAVAIQADLIKMGAEPEKAEAFVNAKELGLDTKQFGMVRQKGKFVGSYANIAKKLAEGSLKDSLTSRVINDEGFAKRLSSLGGSRRGKVGTLIKASEGGKK